MSKTKLKHININSFYPPVDPVDPLYVYENKLFNGIIFDYWSNVIDGVINDPYKDEGVIITREETIVNGKRNGLFKKWYTNGVLCVKTKYKNNIIVGEYVSWYDNGKPECSFFCENGQFNGVYRTWWRNGQLNRELFYEKGVQVGVERMWWDSGQQVLETTYENGRQIDVVFWDGETGQRLFE